MTFAWLFSSTRKHKPKKSCKLRLEELEGRFTPTATSSIGGAVFSDFNLNKVFDAGDAPLAGFTVNLTGTTIGGGTVSTSTVTDANGAFQFAGLEAGTYTLDATQAFFNAPVGLVSSFGGTVTGSAVEDIVLAQGESINDVGFAAQSINPAALTGFSVSLVQLFNTPTTRIVTLPGVGFTNFNGSDGITPTGTGTASLTGTVYNDLTAGGIRASSDPGVAGATVILNGEMNTGAPIDQTTTTASDGTYTFTALPAGSYFLQVVPPSGFRATGATPGTLGGTMVRVDELSPTILTTTAGTGYDFGVTTYAAGLQAFLANDNLADDDVINLTFPTTDASVRGKLDDFSTLSNLTISIDNGTPSSILDAVRSNGTFYLDNDRIGTLDGGTLADGNHNFVITSTDMSGQTSSVTIRLNYTGDGPTFLAPLPNIAGVHGGTSTIRIAGAFSDPAIQDSHVIMNVLEGTTLVQVPIELFDKSAPGSVSNFFSYFGRYSDQGGTVVHRTFDIDDANGNTSLQGVQAGGFFFDSTNDTITAEGSSSDVNLLNEYSSDRPNDAGTLAFAKPGGAPDGATDEFFVNTADVNATTLNVNNTGGFAVFGKIENPADLSVFQQILNAPLSLSTVDPTLVASNSALADMPLTGNSLSAANIFRIQSFTTVSRDSTLTYSMTSSNTSVVTVGALPSNSFQGDLQTLSFIAAGTSTITVTATDTLGHATTQTFIVTVT
jgi:cyclophilin family peptidyl-prolyl cis-trans isomerase